jgi:CubicO group peptidase (beta-lactamase class C family)
MTASPRPSSRVARGRYDESLLTALDDAIEAQQFRGIRAIVVLRNGAPIVERYYGGATADTLHDPRSATKTVASAVLGLALRDGHVSSLDQTLDEFYDLAAYEHPSTAKAAVTLRHLVTMTSGFDGFDFDPESPGNEENMYPEPDWVRWTLDLPMAADREPGERWAYFTAGVVLLGDILNRRLPGGLEAYADGELFAPLGVRDYEWQHTPQRVANTAGGLRMRPGDLARFGQLYANHGRWNGRQVLPEAWVVESLTPRVATADQSMQYGYLWWRSAYSVGGADHAVAFCSGNGGNKVFVFAELPVVIAITATAYGQTYMHRQVDEMMVRYLIPAVA